MYGMVSMISYGYRVRKIIYYGKIGKYYNLLPKCFNTLLHSHFIKHSLQISDINYFTLHLSNALNIRILVNYYFNDLHYYIRHQNIVQKRSINIQALNYIRINIYII